MTADEYKAFCLRELDTHDWQKEHPELAASYREYYVSGGWNEDDLATLVTLHMLYEWCESLAADYDSGLIDKEDDRVVICPYIWRDLPVRVELRDAVIRQCVVEHKLRVLEGIECKPDYTYRSIYEASLAKARAASLAASFSILPGMPDYDEWIKPHADKVSVR
jgi:hypothetical protein